MSNIMRKAVHDVDNFYDYLKHLTTLSTGSLLLLFTFAEKFKAATKLRPLFGTGITFFLACVVLAMICMFFVISSKRYVLEDMPEWEIGLIILTFGGSLLSLMAGVLSLAIFTIKNFCI